ncbi:hypothetical protein Mapa_010298 [Marchantia paleacea]|nr:hypothetical protein Mapa_010298 [Marchantia paleacea]
MSWVVHFSKIIAVVEVFSNFAEFCDKFQRTQLLGGRHEQSGTKGEHALASRSFLCEGGVVCRGEGPFRNGSLSNDEHMETCTAHHA